MYNSVYFSYVQNLDFSAQVSFKVVITNAQYLEFNEVKICRNKNYENLFYLSSSKNSYFQYK
jgi:hypothetical protein